MTQSVEKINIADLIAQRVWLAPAETNKQQVLEQSARLLCEADPALHFEEIFPQILAREEELSTTLDSGLSIPHVRLENFDKTVAALAVLPRPLQDSNGLPIKAVFLFITPVRSEFFQTHLLVLSAAVERFSPSFMDKLAVCQTPEEIVQLLQQPPSAENDIISL